jgi:CubicO group peptidase (beta-lactamase class C family)
MTELASPASLGFDSAGLERIAATLGRWQRLGDAAMQLSLYRWGQPVLDVACGADPFTGQPVRRDTLFCLLSATKGLAAIVLLHLRAQGRFHWQDRVVDYWPEFGYGGKERATIEDVLSHRLGIPALTAPYQRWPDRDYMRRLVERSRAQWPPGTRYGYHGGIFGTVIDELCRRWTGRSLGQVLHEEIARPIGHLDCYIGLPAQAEARLARLLFLEPEQRTAPGFSGMANPPLGWDGEYNNLEVLRSCQPSGGGVASAHDLAGIFNLLALEGAYRGRRFWDAALQRDTTRRRSPAFDGERPASPGLRGGCWGLGFLVAPTPEIFGTVPLGPRTIGHAGASGAVAWADPDTGISFAFTINGLRGRRQLYRNRVLGDLVRQALVG